VGIDATSSVLVLFDSYVAFKIDGDDCSLII